MIHLGQGESKYLQERENNIFFKKKKKEKITQNDYDFQSSTHYLWYYIPKDEKLPSTRS